MPNIAIIDKCPNKVNYSNFFPFEFDLFHLSSVYLQKVLKKDVDIEFDPDSYEFVVLVGAEPTKHYTKASVTNTAGTLIDNKWLPISNPAMLSFKPEGKPDFERALQKVNQYIEGSLVNHANTGDFGGINSELCT